MIIPWEDKLARLTALDHFYHERVGKTPRGGSGNPLQYSVAAVQLLNRVQLFETPWTATLQASLSFTISWNLLKLMSIESMVPSNSLILCHPLICLPSIFPNIRVFSNEYSNNVPWEIPWTEEPGELWSTGSQRVRRDQANGCTSTHHERGRIAFSLA